MGCACAYVKLGKLRWIASESSQLPMRFEYYERVPLGAGALPRRKLSRAVYTLPRRHAEICRKLVAACASCSNGVSEKVGLRRTRIAVARTSWVSCLAGLPWAQARQHDGTQGRAQPGAWLSASSNNGSDRSGRRHTEGLQALARGGEISGAWARRL